MKRVLVSAALFTCAYAGCSPVQGQVTTAIIADTVPGRATGTLVIPQGNVTYIDGGTRVGSNLFHSFAKFDLGTGSFAAWLRTAGDGASIRNVVNRVTGGSASLIDGQLLTLGMPNADFWFVNPAGITFGANAKVNIPNSVHFATAQQLRFADGAVFAATTPQGSTFTSAPPSAFGFLGGQGDIALLGPTLPVGNGKLAFSARNVGMIQTLIGAGGVDLFAAGSGSLLLPLGDPTVVAGSGTITLIDSQLLTNSTAAGNPGAIRLSAGAIQMASTSFDTVAGVASAGGEIALRGGTISLVDGSEIFASTDSSAVSGAIRVNAGATTISQSRVSTGTSGSGASGSLAISTASLMMAGSPSSNAVIGTQSRPGATGALGSISIDAGSVAMEENSAIISIAYGRGNSGDIRLQASTLNSRGGLITSLAYGAGNSGNVSLSAGAMGLNGGGIQSISFGAGNAGNLAVTADVLAVSNNGFIQSSAAPGSLGKSGDISLMARAIALSTGGKITATTQGLGDGGNVAIVASERMDIASGGFVSSESQSQSASADGGNLSLSAPILAIDGGAVSTTAFGGAGGAITLDLGTLKVDHGGRVQSQAFGRGNAGNILVKANNIALTDGGKIDSSTFSNGKGGAITVRAGSLTIGTAANISSTSSGAGDGGAIDVAVSNLELRSPPSADDSLAARIQVSTEGSGNAGSVLIAADHVLLQGGLIAAATSGTPSATVQGNGGSIRVLTPDLVLSGGFISTSAIGGSGASSGDILIDAGTVALRSGSGIGATTDGRGNAGQIRINASSSVTLSGSGILSSTSGTGNAGNVEINAPAIELAESLISSQAGAVEPSERLGGLSGTIHVTAATMSLSSTSFVETTSYNANPAGSITVNSQTLRIGDRSGIQSTNQSRAGGRAGAISISANGIALTEGASITTDSLAGAAGDINISTSRSGRLLLAGEILPGVITTSSGPGTGGRITIRDPYLILSDGGQILALGEEGGANVRIAADYYIRSADRLNRLAVAGSLILDSQIGDLSTGAQPQSLDFLDASAVLRGQCAAGASSGNTSRFSSRITGPYAPLVAPTLPDAEPNASAERPGQLANRGGCGR